jgi:uncharacterized protein YggE
MKKKNLILKVVAFSLITAMLMGMMNMTASANILSTSAGSGTAAPARTLTVFGNGVISVTPDIAILHIAVVTRGEDTSIQKENSAAMDKVVDALKKAGVAERDIRTSGYHMYPDYNWSERGSRELIGYVISHGLMVTVRDVDKAGEILTLAERAGANEINGISFSVSNPEEFYNQALEAAIKDGKAKAAVMAKAAGVTLGNLIDFTEGMNYGQYINNWSVASMGGNVAVMEQSSAGLQTGAVSITASVTMTFAY